jgi:hypothetical protein
VTQQALSAQLALPPAPLPGEFAGEISTQPGWMTRAVHDVIHAHRGTVKVIADALGLKREKAIYQVADGNDPKPIKAWWIPTITRITGSFAILDALEAQVGRVAFVLPPVNPRVEEMNRELARLLQEFGQFLETNGIVLADGKIEPHEVPSMLKAIDAILAGVSEYRAMVLEKATSDAPPAMAKAGLR